MLPALFSPAAAPAACTTLLISALTASVACRVWLAWRQMRHVARHRDAVPAAFANHIDRAAHRKAADYTVARLRLGLVELAISSAMLLVWTLGGALDALDRTLAGWLGTGLWQQVALVGAFVAIGSLADLPTTLWQTFVLEQRFGFNRMTPGLWLADAAKSAALGVLLGLPLVALLLWLMAAAGTLWWLWAWGAWAAFTLALLVVYPIFIAPLFNRFQPLADEALRARVTALMQRCGFSARGLYVMDGSRRSAHANAYFTGFGAAKRVVFYDTLLARLSPGEVDAVLAHELGHFRYRHIAQRVGVMLVAGVAGFALLGWLATQGWFYAGLGVRPEAAAHGGAPALLLFLLVVPVLGYFAGPLSAHVSRRHEFEADAFAVAQTGRADLAEALLKLYEDNASTLTPDPLYARFYYSHPPAAERLARIAAA